MIKSNNRLFACIQIINEQNDFQYTFTEEDAVHLSLLRSQPARNANRVDGLTRLFTSEVRLSHQVSRDLRCEVYELRSV